MYKLSGPLQMQFPDPSLQYEISGVAVVKNLPASAGDGRDMVLIPGLGRTPGEGNGNSLQYSCLENSMDRGAWKATVHGVAKSWTQLSNLSTTITFLPLFFYFAFNFWYCFRLLHSLNKTLCLRLYDLPSPFSTHVLSCVQLFATP